jgi:hypothetical protein
MNGSCPDGSKLSVDEFMLFWQDTKLRESIHRKAWLCSKTPEDLEDLKQEGWEAICLLPPDASFQMAEKVAIRAIDKIRKRSKREEKYLSKKCLETSQYI